MTAESFVRPWSGRVLRHIPGSSPFGPLDTRFAARSRENHWNRAGEPTLYLARDGATLIAEFGRHYERDRAPELAELVQTRRVVELEIALTRLFDLTDPAAVAALGIEGAPGCFRDRTVARATAGFLRDVFAVEALLAPATNPSSQSAAPLLVLFLDRLQAPLSDVARSVTPAGSFQLKTG